MLVLVPSRELQVKKFLTKSKIWPRIFISLFFFNYSWSHLYEDHVFLVKIKRLWVSETNPWLRGLAIARSREQVNSIVTVSSTDAPDLHKWSTALEIKIPSCTNGKKGTVLPDLHKWSREIGWPNGIATEKQNEKVT